MLAPSPPALPLDHVSSLSSVKSLPSFEQVICSRLTSFARYSLTKPTMHPPPVLDSDRELMDQAKEELAVLPDEAQSPHSSLDPRLSYSSSLPKDSLVRTDIAHAKAETPTPLNTTTQERAVHWVGTKFNTVKNADDTIIGTVRLTRQRSPIDSADATVPWISSETIDDGTPVSCTMLRPLHMKTN